MATVESSSAGVEDWEIADVSGLGCDFGSCVISADGALDVPPGAAEASTPAAEKVEVWSGNSEDTKSSEDMKSTAVHNGCDSWICAICLDKIQLEELAQVKGCEHSYCITCVLQWASYKENPWCPQCRHPFSMLYLYRSLDGSVSDYMVEEPVCLLLCASWFSLPEIEESEHDEEFIDTEDYYEEDVDIVYPVRIGNRRWGEHGYVRGGRMEARPRPTASSGEVSGSNSSRNKASGGAGTSSPGASGSKPLGRRAKRAQQRQREDQAGGSKPLRHGGRR